MYVDLEHSNKTLIPFEKLDAEVAIEIFEKECSKIVQEFSKIQVPKIFEKTFSFELNEFYLKYEIPTKEIAMIQETFIGIKQMMSLFSFDDFLFIFLSLLKEKSMVFVSTN